MADLSSVFNGGFDPSTVEETNTTFEVLPKGNYIVTITASELTPIKDGKGQMLTLKLETENNRVLFDNLCVVHNTSQAAQNIAQTKLKQITTALGLTKVTDSSQLHDKPLIAHVTVELDKYRTEQNGGEKTFRNNVSGYSPVSKSATTATEAPDNDIPF